MTNGNLGNAVAGLLGVAIVAKVASDMMGKNRLTPRAKLPKKKKVARMTW